MARGDENQPRLSKPRVHSLVDLSEARSLAVCMGDY